MKKRIFGYGFRAGRHPWLEYKNVLALRALLAGLLRFGAAFCKGIKESPRAAAGAAVEHMLKSPWHLPPEEATLLPVAEGSSDHCRAGQPCSHRRRVPIFEQARLFGTEFATIKIS